MTTVDLMDTVAGIGNCAGKPLSKKGPLPTAAADARFKRQALCLLFKG